MAEPTTKTDHKQDLNVSTEELRRVGRKIFPNMPESAIETNVEYWRENPEEFYKLQDLVPPVEAKDIKAQFSSLQEDLDSVMSAYNVAWMPENPTEYHTEGEKRSMSFKRFVDNNLSFFVGSDHVESFERGLEGKVMSRHRTSLKDRLGKGISNLEKMQENFNSMREQYENVFFDSQEEAESLCQIQEVIDRRLRDLPEEINQSYAKSQKPTEVGRDKFTEVRQELKDLKLERREYVRQQRDTDSRLIVLGHKVKFARSIIGRVGPIAEKAFDFHAELTLMRDIINVYDQQPEGMINPQEFVDLNTTYVQANSTLSKLEEGFDGVNGVMSKGLPTELYPNFDMGVDQQSGLTNQEEAYVAFQGGRHDTAKAIGKEIRDMQMPYV